MVSHRISRQGDEHPFRIPLWDLLDEILAVVTFEEAIFREVTCRAATVSEVIDPLKPYEEGCRHTDLDKVVCHLVFLAGTHHRIVEGVDGCRRGVAEVGSRLRTA